jgi:hypothetical protein
MTTPRWNDPREDADNPHRAAERAAVRDEIAARLAEHGVTLTGDESDEQVVRLLDAVDDFERARSLVGGDSMVNDRRSSSPDDPAFVIPVRQGDEPVERYVDRIRAAAARLG